MAETGNASPQPCPACGTLVDVASAEPLARVLCSNCGEKFRVRSVFDQFEIVETLGVGGMGSVYKAHDTRLERFVALKLLRKELSSDPAEAARLEQEARLTAAVNHPHVIQVYSAGSAHGQIYLVMELVDHGSLDDLMAQHARVPERDVLNAGIQVAKGLQAAQERGLIHRDVKPANILFADANTAKIGDFGLAVAAEHQAEARHEIWGTPYYVAPERLDSAPEDFRSDIYSLGATLFHAMAGQPPIEGETTSASELRKLKANPPALRSVAPSVSRETARVIDRMLAPEPTNRFASYAELIARLENARAALEPRRRKSPLVMLTLVALLALAAAAVFVLHQRKVAPPQPASSPPAENVAELEKRYDEARAQLLRGNYEAAASAFVRLASDSKRQPLQNWSRFHAGLSLLLAGKLPAARDIFRQVETAGLFSTAKTDAALANFFIESAKALAAPGPIRGGTELNANGPNALALFLYGLKDWQLREFDEAAGLLQQFVRADVPNECKWIADYKPLAQKFLADHALYAEAKTIPAQLGKAAAARAALVKIRELEKRVQTRGALPDYLKEQENGISGRIAPLEKSEQEAEERAREEDFERRRPALLAQWRSFLIKDLASGSYKQQITIGATTYQGVTTANDREITFRIAPYGGAPITWDKIPPELLLQLSRAFIKPGAPDAAERQWLAAIYAQSTGQGEAAHQLAEEAAKAKPQYREELPFLLKAEH